MPCKLFFSLPICGQLYIMTHTNISRCRLLPALQLAAPNGLPATLDMSAGMSIAQLSADEVAEDHETSEVVVV
jgi:hypothetical protein